jgi:hypothetical protein
VLHRILRFEFGTHCIGCYSIPAGGLVVVRSSQAFSQRIPLTSIKRWEQR